MASIPQAFHVLRSMQLRKIALARGFRTTARSAVATNFKMPAMSPTMTEGNIASWKVREGEKFKAGDVLLEIETDKAQIDVEAQEDGVMAKIFVDNGAKGIPIGRRIAVLAEPDDDLSTLKIPDEPTPKSPAPAEPEAEEKRPQAAPAPLPPSAQAASSTSNGPKKHHRPPKEPFTPSPSVMGLLHRNNLTKDDIPKIPATGPRGRLLKGDVLAYVGSINKSSPAAIETIIDKYAHLDLSNIIVKQTPPAAPTPEKDAAAEKKSAKPVILETDIQAEFSLSKLSKFQSEIQARLGFTPPLSAFLTAASLQASANLPPSKLPPSPNEIFSELLGLPKSPSATPPYKLQLTSLPPPPPPTSTPAKKPDIIDLLSGTKPKPSVKKAATTPAPAAVNVNVLSVKVHPSDENRAKVYLERVKALLEGEPEKLFVAWGEEVKASSVEFF